jgi:PAS domain S-box-containing protein/putative nucleotidyltransferase with HDIG domain
MNLIPLNVLILEDKPTDAELLVFELQRAGYSPVWQRVDAEADYRAQLLTLPQIILADYNLPQFNALAALQILQSENLDIPFIVVTGTASEEAAVAAMRSGAADYLLKDRLSRLGPAVQRALEEKILREEKRAADEALRTSEEKFSKAFYISPDAVGISRLDDGSFVEVNHGFTEMSGYTPEEVVGKSGLTLEIWINSSERKTFYRHLLKYGAIDNFEFTFRRKDGALRFGNISARQIEIRGEKHVIAISRDITETKLAAEVLQKAHDDLAHAYDETIEGWSRVLDLRDKETEGHTQRVTELTLRMARALGIPEPEIVHIRRGALLHDIGKMAIPDQILQKPGPLTEQEWVEMRRHPEYAYQMLYPIAYLRPALDIPYCHHERWDGTGYPRGIHGHEIPLAARIFSIIDVWDALCSDRPYRKGCVPADVIDYIVRHAEIYFDPEIVVSFVRLYKQGLFDDKLPAHAQK